MASRRRATGAVPLVLVLLAGCVQSAPPAMEEGVVLVVTPAHQAGENGAGGAVTGLVVGVVAGGVIGGVVGGVAGSMIEAAGQPMDAAAYTIRLRSGRILTVVQHLRSGEAAYQPGRAVGIETRGARQRVVAMQNV